MKTLVVSFYYPPIGGSGLPGAQRAVKFIRNFTVISPHLLTVRPEDYSPFFDLNFPLDLPINNETIYRTAMFDVFGYLLKIRSFFTGKKGIGIVREGGGETCPSWAASGGKGGYSFFQRIKDFIYDMCHFPDGASGWVLPALIEGYKIIKKESIKVIFATGTPWSALIIAYVLNKLTGIPYVVDFRDPWIGNPFHKSKGRFLDCLGMWLERKVVENAGFVCVNTEPLRDEFCSRYSHLPPDKFVTLPNGYDLGDFKAIIPNQLGCNHGGLLLAHAGGLYGKRDPAMFLEALSLTIASKDEEGNFKFLQIGEVGLDYNFKDRFSLLIESNVIELTGMLSYQECLKKLAEADVLILIQPGTKTQVPSKLYDYLCLNRPILTITPLEGALGQMVQKYGFGDVFEPSDVQGIARKLKELADMKRKDGYLRADYPQKIYFDIKQITSQLEKQLVHLSKISG